MGSDEREFCSVTKNEVLMSLSLPELNGRRCLEAGFGWLLTLTNDGEGDAVLLVPEVAAWKPHVAIIKGISQNDCEGVTLNVQWFYRPEDVPMESVDTRELFYSEHRDDGVVAESVMHKATVHFLPLDEKLPERKKYPGFVCQCAYDCKQKILRKFADKKFDSTFQQETVALLQKTASHLGV